MAKRSTVADTRRGVKTALRKVKKKVPKGPRRRKAKIKVLTAALESIEARLFSPSGSSFDHCGDPPRDFARGGRRRSKAR